MFYDCSNFQNDLMKFKLFKGAPDADKIVPAGKLHNSAKIFFQILKIKTPILKANPHQTPINTGYYALSQLYKIIFQGGVDKPERTGYNGRQQRRDRLAETAPGGQTGQKERKR